MHSNGHIKGYRPGSRAATIPFSAVSIINQILMNAIESQTVVVCDIARPPMSPACMYYSTTHSVISLHNCIIIYDNIIILIIHTVISQKDDNMVYIVRKCSVYR